MSTIWKRITAALIAVAVVAGVAGSAGVSASSAAGQDCVDAMGSGAAADMIERLAECGVTPDEVKWTSDGWAYVGSDDGSPAGAKMSAIWGTTINPPEKEEPLRVAKHEGVPLVDLVDHAVVVTKGVCHFAGNHYDDVWDAYLAAGCHDIGGS